MRHKDRSIHYEDNVAVYYIFFMKVLTYKLICTNIYFIDRCIWIFILIDAKVFCYLFLHCNLERHYTTWNQLLIIARGSYGSSFKFWFFTVYLFVYSMDNHERRLTIVIISSFAEEKKMNIRWRYLFFWLNIY